MESTINMSIQHNDQSSYDDSELVYEKRNIYLY